MDIYTNIYIYIHKHIKPTRPKKKKKIDRENEMIQIIANTTIYGLNLALTSN